jgi:two-component system sensor histidine kinase YesM
MVDNVKEIQKNYYLLATQRIVTHIENDLNIVTSLSNKISFDQNLYEMLEQEYEEKIDYVEVYYNYFVPYLFLNGSSYQQVNTAVIYTDNDYILNSGYVFKINDEIRSEKWFQQVVKYPDNIHVIYGETYVKSNNVIITPLSVVKVLDEYEGLDKYLKIIRINLHTEKIINTIIGEKLKGNVFIIDQNGNVLFADNNIPEKVNLEKYLDNKDEQIVTERLNNGLDWTVINVIDQYDIQEALKEPRKNIIFLTTISLLAASLIILLISRSFYNRLNALSEHVNNLAKEDFSKQYTGPQGKDEIGNLINAFNKMVIKIKTLIKDVYEAKLEQSQIMLEKKQAELNALQSQMNPHFLFNTLESIRMKSLEKKEIETANIIKYLARSFQRMISFQQEWIKVSEEVGYIKDFLKIQKYRFGSELEYTLDIDPEVLDYKIPKLIIQPFVENACIHGVGGSEEVGRIQVEIQLVENKLKCIVSDNGIGMTQEKLNSLLDSIKEQDNQEDNIAIKNIYRRLSLYYGDSFELSIESKEGIGTLITLIIPMEV